MSASSTRSRTKIWRVAGSASGWAPGCLTGRNGVTRWFWVMGYLYGATRAQGHALDRSLFGLRSAVGEPPAEMLAAVEGDHLPGQRRRLQDEAKGAADLLGRGAATERQPRALLGELGVALARAWQRRARADGVDAHARRQGERERLRQAPQRDLADRVRGEVRRQVPDPLIQQVDDIGLEVAGQARGQRLHEHDRRAQIGLEMGVPARAGRARNLVALEARGVVDQAGDRAERRRDARRQGLGL